jgi:hypothetical protein
VFDLNQRQVGLLGTVRGGPVVGGRPFSPSLPKAKRDIAKTRGRGTGTYKPSPNALHEREKNVIERELWALSLHSVTSSGYVFQCPAAAGKLDCPLRPPTKRLRPGALPVLNAPEDPLPGSVCTQSYSSFAFEELPLMQKDVHGSPEWTKSYGRRGGSVEPYFGALKDQAGSGVARGKIRVKGIFKTGLLLGLAIAATTDRLLRTFTARKTPSTKPKRRPGRPRKDGLAAFRQIALDATQSKTVVLKT